MYLSAHVRGSWITRFSFFSSKTTFIKPIYVKTSQKCFFSPFILLETKFTKLKWLTCNTYGIHWYVSRFYVLLRYNKLKWQYYICNGLGVRRIICLTHFTPMLHFYVPWKRQKTMFSDVFRRYRNVTLDWNGLNTCQQPARYAIIIRLCFSCVDLRFSYAEAWITLTNFSEQKSILSPNAKQNSGYC